VSTIAATERISLRTDAETKFLLEKAAQAMNMSISSYLLSVSSRQAASDLKAFEEVHLCTRDSKVFYEALNDPPKPNEALKMLMSE